MTAKKIALPLFLFFLIGTVSAYTSKIPDIASLVVSTVLTFVVVLIPFWALFIFAMLAYLVIKTLGG